jgi:sulfatase modifying factor 1
MAIAVRTGEAAWRLEHDLAVNKQDGSMLLRVAAGEFEMGDGQDADCPKHRVHLDEYWIGAYCVTNGQYGRFVQEAKHSAPSGGPWSNGTCRADAMDHPVTYVNWEDAQSYAKWSGLALPTEAQWEKAARGPLGLVYPWGPAWDVDLCRNDKNKGSGNTAEVWRYGRGVSGHGTYQQSGNVWEWCADWWDEKYYDKSEREHPRCPDGGSLRVRRGSCWWFGFPSFFRGAHREWLVPSNRNDNLGFRLVRNVRELA